MDRLDRQQERTGRQLRKLLIVDQAQFDNFAQFVTEYMSRFSEGMQELRLRQNALERQQGRTHRQLRAAIRVGAQWMRTEQQMKLLAESQRVTEVKLQAFIDSLRQGNGRRSSPDQPHE